MNCMANSALEPGQIISHFKIEKLLGQGGMASVYLAKDINLSRLVALKFMNRESVAMNGNPDYVKNLEFRFKREAQSAAQINHPNIAQLYEASFDRDNWFIAMEYIEGKSIREYLDSGKSYSVREILRILKQVARGLKYAWDNYQIVHRDITPQNLMMSGSSVIKIIDLGLAKPVIDGGIDTEIMNLTTAGAPVGTPYYMAPEQAAGATDIDHRADIFSLGATMYEISTRQKPFNAKTPPMIYMAQLEKKYQPINHISKNFPEKLEQLIYAMLEPNREERIDSFFSILKTVNSISSATPTLTIEIDKSIPPTDSDISETDDFNADKDEQSSDKNVAGNDVNDRLALDIERHQEKKQEDSDDNPAASQESKVENLISEIKEKCNLPALQVNP